MMGMSFFVIFHTCRFFHFAHGIVYTSGAYFTLVFMVFCGFPLALSIFFSVILCALFGCLMDLYIYRPLRRRNASPLTLLLASLGIYVAVQNLISMIFGEEIRGLRSAPVKEGLTVWGVRVTDIQIVTMCACAALVICLIVILRKTRIGRAMRAVANDSELATVCGIKSNRVILCSFALGSALGGAAGILVALDVDMTPTMGMYPLMMGVVAVIISGARSVPGVVLGAFLLGMAQHLGVWRISTQWQDAIAFVILLIFLVVRPQGFLGKKVKKATV